MGDKYGDVRVKDNNIDEVAAVLVFPDNTLSQVDNDGVKFTLPSANHVLEYTGNPETVDCGHFWDQQVVDLGPFLWEAWSKFLTGADSSKYIISEGYGGAHAILFSGQSGNVYAGTHTITDATNASPIVVTTATAHRWSTGAKPTISGVTGNTAANGTTPITVLSPTTFSIDGSTGNGAYAGGGTAEYIHSFGSDAQPYIDQWAHVAVGWINDLIVVYYDGVPVGGTVFKGPRRASLSAGANLFIGGSDHSNFLGRLSQLRGFEGVNPHTVGSKANQSAFIPQTVFGPQWSIGNRPQANFLCHFFTVQQIITDHSHGYPKGHTHSGRIRGTDNGGITSDRSSYPPPQFVIDTGAPNPLADTAPVQPAGKVYTPASIPGGALIFDSFERKNATFAFEGLGGLGSTEGGSLGAKTWNGTTVPNFATVKSFGILNEEAVCLDNNADRIARVEVSQANLDIRVDRHRPSTWGMGISTSILFRYVDDNNFWFATTEPSDGLLADTQYLFVGKYVGGGSPTFLITNDPLQATWTTLRVVTKTDGTVQVYTDALLEYSTTDTALDDATQCGLYVRGLGAGLIYRWDNFSVFAAS